jgi:hypothetical protein
LAVELLDHADTNLAEAAQALLAADSLQLRSQGRSYLTLPPEMLHKMCWRIVAALELLSGSQSDTIIHNARALIATYDEAQTAPASARKIVHFLGGKDRAALSNPHYAGIHLFVGHLSADLIIGHDHILRLIDFESAFPMMVMLAAAGFPKHAALQTMIDLRPQILSAREAALFEADYAHFIPKIARQQLSDWSSARSLYLSYGRT